MAAMLATGGCGAYNHDGRAVSLAGLRGTALMVAIDKSPRQFNYAAPSSHGCHTRGEAKDDSVLTDRENRFLYPTRKNGMPHSEY